MDDSEPIPVCVLSSVWKPRIRIGMVCGVCVCVCVCVFSRVQLFATPRTVAHQALLSMRFSRQEYWSGFPLPTLGIFPTQHWNSYLLCLLHWEVDSLPLHHQLSSVQFSRSVMPNSLDPIRPHGLQHSRLPCPSPTPRACSNSCPSSQ